VDVILDMVAASYFARNVDCLALEGRLVVISLIGGSRTELNLNTVMAKRIFITGSTLRIRTVAQKALVAEGVRRNVWPLLEEHRVHPVIHATFPLADAAEAHRTIESSQHIGKIVLTL
jgi:NADPH:quinone reductase-like Zn-dependent oxidoreductase